MKTFIFPWVVLGVQGFFGLTNTLRKWHKRFPRSVAQKEVVVKFCHFFARWGKNRSGFPPKTKAGN